MKINAVISKPSIKFDLSDKLAMFSAVIIAVGIVTGAMIYSVAKSEIVNLLCEYFTSFVTDFANKNKPEIISGLILSNIPYFIMMLIFGTNVAGTPGVIALTYAKSMGIGLLYTYIYEAYALKGIEFCLLVLLPGKFVLIFAIILLTQNCMLTSNNLRKNLKCEESRVVPLHKFALRSMIIAVIFILSSVVDYFTLTGFSALFDFN